MKNTYGLWQFLGILATGALYLKIVSLNGGDYLGTLLWLFPLLMLIEFGCFAARDKKHEERRLSDEGNKV